MHDSPSWLFISFRLRQQRHWSSPNLDPKAPKTRFMKSPIPTTVTCLQMVLPQTVLQNRTQENLPQSHTRFEINVFHVSMVVGIYLVIGYRYIPYILKKSPLCAAWAVLLLEAQATTLKSPWKRPRAFPPVVLPLSPSRGSGDTKLQRDSGFMLSKAKS